MSHVGQQMAEQDSYATVAQHLSRLDVFLLSQLQRFATDNSARPNPERSDLIQSILQVRHRPNVNQLTSVLSYPELRH